MPATQRVRRLFPIFASNLRLYVPEAPDVFVCPICRSVFGPDSLAEAECPVSEGHILPEAVGGSESTLECRRCNNQLGSKIDSHLVRQAHWASFQSDGGRRSGVLDIDGQLLRVVAHRTGSHMDIEMVAESNHPDAAAAACERVLANPPSVSISFDTRHNPAKARFALVHSAFLRLFHTFGYEYPLSAGGGAVANWLFTRTPPSSLGALVHLLPQTDDQVLSDHRLGVAIIDESFLCFALAFPGASLSAERRVAYLPAFEQDALENFVGAFARTPHALTARIRPVAAQPPLEHLADEASRWAGHTLLAHFPEGAERPTSS